MQVDEVLVRTISLDDPPYSVTIYYKGFEIGLIVYEKNLDNKGATTIPATDPLIATKDISTKTEQLSQRKLSKKRTLAQNRGVCTELKNVVFDPTDSSSQTALFEYDSETYLVSPTFSFVYTIEFSESDFSTHGISKQTVTPPVSPPKKQRVEGTVTEVPNDKSRFTHPEFEFSFGSSWLKLFKKLRNSSIYFEIREPQNTF